MDGKSIKDISKLEKDLNKVIIIDNIEESFMLQPENGLDISEFKGDGSDRELLLLLDDLLSVAKFPWCKC